MALDYISLLYCVIKHSFWKKRRATANKRTLYEKGKLEKFAKYWLDENYQLCVIEYNKNRISCLPAVRNISWPSSAGFLEPDTGACWKINGSVRKFVYR